jgi:uracil-DNA glycosylase
LNRFAVGILQAKMSDSARAQFEEWLKYADDLGLGPFFRDRELTGRPEATREAASPAAPSVAPLQTPPPTPSRISTEMPKPKSETRSASSIAPARAANASPLPIFPAAAAPSLFDAGSKIENDTLERIREDLGECTRCKLHKQRHSIVFGSGNPSAKLVFVGEGPGADEDAQGLPFVGRAGKLLTQMIEAMGLKREDVYICNVVKCRPPENRQPEKDEVSTCLPYLTRQIDTIRPQVIVCLGATAAQALLNTTQSISRFRGEWLDFRNSRLMVTYHPAYLLRNPAAKPEVWKDLQKVMAVLGLQPKKAVSPR